ncbi:MAG: cell division protein SepF [Clostridia bacterium]|nr:cell division protein SepF [Oscillospiraceae bacterium]MBR4892563.1 cell division protein SepF [Clostridia bacterium]
MANFFKKTMEFIGLSDEDENIDVEPVEEKESEREKKNDSFSVSPKKNKVVNIHTTTQLKVVVYTPNSFDSAREIADHLKAKKPVVINLENVETSVGRRIIDFLTGSVYAVDGSIQKIADRIFLIAPYNVGIMGGDVKDELMKNKIVFPYTNR